MENLLVNYYLNLKKQYYAATGKTQESIEYVLKWHYNRKSMLLEYSNSLLNIKNSEKRWKDFLNNAVEVGIIGKENTVSPYLPKISTISPVGFVFESRNAYTVSLEEIIEENDIEGAKFLSAFDTYLSHNPNFDKEESTLNALKDLAWRYPTVSVSVFGSVHDKDRVQKIEKLKEYMDQIITHYGEDKIGKVIEPIVREIYTESENGTYINTIITDQYTKSLLPEEILQGKLNELTDSISSVRYLTLERGNSKDGR